MPLGLYISVPFCRTKCSYCNFASDVFSKSAYENYVARLLEDIANSHQLASELGCALGSTADAIYLGGGTPSILDAPQLLRIFAAAPARDQDHTARRRRLPARFGPADRRAPGSLQPDRRDAGPRRPRAQGTPQLRLRHPAKEEIQNGRVRQTLKFWRPPALSGFR